MLNKNDFCDRFSLFVKKGEYAKFGRKSGVAAKSIENYAKGETQPTLKILLKIAKACGVTVGWLAAGEYPKYPQQSATVDPDQDFDMAEKVLDITKVYRRKTDNVDKITRDVFEWIVELSKHDTGSFIDVATLAKERVEALKEIKKTTQHES